MAEKKFTNVMLDLETMGVSNSAAIVQIGACEFDLETGEIGKTFLTNVDIASSLAAGLTVDGDTLKWWLAQSKDAQDIVMASPDTLEHALELFNHFIDGMGACRIWCHAGFDMPILLNAFRAIKMKPKFGFRAYMDNHTFDLRLWDFLAKEIERAEKNLTESPESKSVTGWWFAWFIDLWKRIKKWFQKKDDKIKFAGVKHTALDDCKHQVKYVVRNFKILKGIRAGEKS